MKNEDNLKLLSVSKKRTFQCAIFLGILLPVIILEFHKSHYTKEFWLISVCISFLAVPLIYFTVFYLLRSRYKCKKCKTLWVFRKVNEIFLERYMDPVDEHDSKLILNEKFFNEIECSQCGHQDLVLGYRKIISEKKNEKI